MSATEFGIRSDEATGFDAAGEARGLYDPALGKDSCGVGFIADIKGRKSHAIVQDALTIVRNLEHRGAVGADPRAGDGAGILVQIPHKFFAKKARERGFSLPEPGRYAVIVLFLPHDDDSLRQEIMDLYAEQSTAAGMEFLGWRDVPTDNSTLGESVKPTEPVHRQLFIGQGANDLSEDDFERRIYLLRKSISGMLYGRHGRNTALYYPVSSSCRTVIYKGMFLADQLPTYYPDLHDPDFESALALIHQRFSTNTFPAWSLAHPYRYIAHNGEINTLRGNLNWMAARQASARSPLFGEDIEKLWPISYEGQSDTACFDNALEFLVQGGYSLAHAVMMMIPEAWAGNQLMDAERRAFYEYNAALMEPWDGPAAIAFTDGRQIGATLDRNGLRPARYIVTRDDRIIMASEMGVLHIPEKDIVTKWRLQPGKMLLVDLEEGRLIPDEEIKAALARSNPYHDWLQRTQIILEDLPKAKSRPAGSNLSLLDRQQAFGYTQEDIKILMTPMAATGDEPTGSMGNDTPISALSDRPKLLFTYFKQNFAQVTNPPIDPIREELVMSLVSIIGPRPNLFDLEGVSHVKRLEVRQPILTNEDLEKIRWISEVGDPHFKSVTLHAVWPAEHGAAGMRAAIGELCREAEEAVRDGVNIISIVGDAMALPLIQALEQHPGRWDLSRVITFGNGGAVFSQHLQQRLKAVLPHIAISNGMGSSESGAIGGTDRGNRDGGFMQFDPRPDLAVISDDHRILTTPGSEGTLARTGYTPVGYYGDAKKTAETFVRIDGRVWVITGDRARIDDEGRPVVMGRRSQCIHSGGETVFAEAVEAAVRHYTAVQDVLVVGAPDERWGQKVVAVVTLARGASFDRKEFDRVCRERLAGYKVPREVVVSEEIRRSPAGKADYAWAKRVAAERLGEV